MQRVEEKVRVKLHLERLQLRFRELGLQLRGERFALAVSFSIIEGVADAEDCPVDEEVEEEEVSQLGLILNKERVRIAPDIERPDDHPESCRSGNVNSRKGDGR